MSPEARRAATEAARQTLMGQFRQAAIDAAAANGIRLSEDEIEDRAARLRSTYFSQMRLAAISRRRAANAPRPEVNARIKALTIALS